MGCTFTPHNWKECIFQRGCSWSVQSILGSGLIPGGKESDKARQAVFFATLNSFRWKSRWRRTPWWFRSSSESALSQSLETASRCRLVGKIVKSTRFGIANLANNVICDHHPQSCVRRLHLQSNLWENKRSSIVRNTLNLKAKHPKLRWKASGLCSSSGSLFTMKL